MAASIEEVSYEFGSLIAVAVLGSLLSLFYTSPHPPPPGRPCEAADSIATARDLASDHRACSTPPLSRSTAATTIMIIIAVVIAWGVITTGWLLRRYGPGSTASAYEDNTH